MDMQIENILLSVVSGTQLNNVESIKKTSEKFSDSLRKNEIDNIKSDIRDKYGINVGDGNNSFECFIPGDVLYRMNSDVDLRKKVYAMLDDYTSTEFRMKLKTLSPPVKKCMLVFDENGDVVATMEPDVEKDSKNVGISKEADSIMKKSNNNEIVLENTYDSYQNLEMNAAVLTTAIRKKLQLGNID